MISFGVRFANEMFLYRQEALVNIWDLALSDHVSEFGFDDLADLEAATSSALQEDVI